MKSHVLFYDGSVVCVVYFWHLSKIIMQKCVCLSDIALKSPLLANGGAPMSFFSLHPRHGRPGRRGGDPLH